MDKPDKATRLVQTFEEYLYKVDNLKEDDYKSILHKLDDKMEEAKKVIASYEGMQEKLHVDEEMHKFHNERRL